MAKSAVTRRTADALANALADAIEDIEWWMECAGEVTAEERAKLRKWKRTLAKYQEQHPTAA
jgi:hypothetical protein